MNPDLRALLVKYSLAQASCLAWVFTFNNSDQIVTTGDFPWAEEIIKMKLKISCEQIK